MNKQLSLGVLPASAAAYDTQAPLGWLDSSEIGNYLAGLLTCKEIRGAASHQQMLLLLRYAKTPESNACKEEDLKRTVVEILRKEDRGRPIVRTTTTTAAAAVEACEEC